MLLLVVYLYKYMKKDEEEIENQEEDIKLEPTMVWHRLIRHFLLLGILGSFEFLLVF